MVMVVLLILCRLPLTLQLLVSPLQLSDASPFFTLRAIASISARSRTPTR